MCGIAFRCFCLSAFIFSAVLADSTGVAYKADRFDSLVIITPAVIVRPQDTHNDFSDFIGSVKLNSREIKNAAGNFDDPARTLSMLPGVTRLNNYRNDLIVNGGAPSENLFIVDGIRIQNINHFGSQTGTGGVISFINPDYISSLQFAAGGFPAQYGERVSSVSSITLKSGNMKNYSARADISATQFALGFEGPAAGSTSFLLSARRSYLDLVFKYSGFIFTPQFYDLLAKTETDFGRSKLTFLFMGALDKIILFDAGNDPRYNNPRALGSNQNHFISGLSFKNVFDNGYFNIILSREMLNYQTVPNMLFENSSGETSNSFDIDFGLNLSAETGIRAGASARMINYTAKIRMKPFFTTYKEKIGLDSLDTDRDYLKASAYFEYLIRFNNKWNLDLGVRADFFDGIRASQTFSPRLAAKYNFTPFFSAALNLGAYFQPPEYLYLAADPSNYLLKNIECRQLEAGLNYDFSPGLSSSVWGFYKSYSKYPSGILRPYLVLSNTGADFSGVDDNFAGYGLEPLVSRGGGISKGLKAVIHGQSPGSEFSYTASAAFGFTDYYGSDGISRPGSYDQRWNLVFTGIYRPGRNWTFYYKFRYASGTPYTPFEADGSQNWSKMNTMRFDDQHSLDVRIEKMILFNNIRMNSYIDVQNVYNKKARSLIRWDKKTGKIADDPVLGIVPSIGISVVFN